MKPAAIKDLPAVLALLEASGLPTAGVAKHFGRFVVETEGEALVGVAGLEIHGEAALLRSVAVRSDRRGQGIGDALVAEAIGAASRAGLRAIHLLTETAEPYFATRGFVRVERAGLPGALAASEELRGACPDSAVAMRLDLIGAPLPHQVRP